MFFILFLKSILKLCCTPGEICLKRVYNEFGRVTFKFCRENILLSLNTNFSFKWFTYNNAKLHIIDEHFSRNDRVIVWI